MVDDNFHLFSKDLFEIAVQTNSNAIAFTDSAFLIHYANDKFCDIIGFQQNDVINKNIWDFVKTDITDEQVKERIFEEQSITTTGKLRKLDGENIEIIINASLIGKHIEETVYIFNLEDKTNELMLKDILTNSIVRYHQLFEHSTSGIIILRPIQNGQAFLLKDINVEAQKIEKVNKQNVIDNLFDENLPGIYSKELFDIVKRVNENGIAELIQIACNNYEDGKIWKEYSVFKLSTGEIVLIVNDQTEKIQAKLELMKSKERLESILRIYELKSTSKNELVHISLDEATQLTESDFAFYLNYQAHDETLTHFNLSNKGYKYSKIKDIKDTYSIEEMGEWAEAIRQKMPIINNHFDNMNFLKGLPLSKFECRRCLIMPIIKEDELKGVVGLINKKENYTNSDILQVQLLLASVLQLIEFQEYQENYYRIKIKAEQSDELKKAFLKNMSHEIRTPLNGIIGFTQLLMNNEIREDDRKEYVNLLKQSTNRLVQIIDNVLDMSLIEKEEAKIELSEVDVNFILEDLLNCYSELAKAKGIELEATIDENNENYVILSDYYKLRQSLYHLIDNAVKFTKQGKITFGYKIVGDEILFFVKDTGIGIPAEYQGIIFDRFVQSDLKLSRKFEGAGLGLSISKGFIELLGGKIWVESEPNVGSLFQFLIPFKPVIFDETKGEEEKMEKINTEKDITILIAEDDDINYLVLYKLLEKMNFHLIRANDGVEAVNIVKENKNIELILMDLKMPHLDGFEASKQIKEIAPNIPIIAVSAFSAYHEKQKAAESGCNEYIEKPINLVNVVNTIKKYI
ncbi:MAG: ATP-binding protein [Candidatus Kapaibacteriota bacterium]